MTTEPDFLPPLAATSQVREQALADLAYRQHGTVARRQLLALGFTRHEIQHLLHSGHLHSLFPGVYAVGHRRLTWKGRYMAAVLACGPDAVLSHRSAAVLHGILRSNSATVHVTVPATGRPKRRGIKLHEARDAAQYRVTVDGIPVTSIARTLLSLAASVDDTTLARALEESERKKLFKLAEVEQMLAANPGARGTRALNKALVDYRPGPGWTRSDLEDRFLAELRKAGLPQPAVNNWVAGHEVDCVWFGEKLVVELDGGDYHHTTAARERDPRRDAELQIAGYAVLRVTDKRLAADAKGVVRDVARLLTR